MWEAIAFYSLAIFLIYFAFKTITVPNPIHSALYLVLTMIGLGAAFFNLNAQFIAGVQMIVYAGAVMVLFIFVIMLLNAGLEEHIGRSWVAKVLGFPAFFALIGLLCFFVQKWFPNSGSVKFGDFMGGGAKEIGMALFTEYLLPFEVTSVLILIAIIGAIVLARKELD